MGKVSNIIVRVLEDDVIATITGIWFVAWMVLLIVFGKGEPPMTWFHTYVTPLAGLLLLIRTIKIW